MPSFTTGDIRNIVFVGHVGAGKTSLVDAMLFSAGAVNRKGSVADGTSFSDFEKEEKEHQHSLYASVLHLEHQGRRINVLDTPGSPDLIGQAIACLPAVETAAVVINAQNGIELITRRMMDMAKTLNMPRMIIVNRMDAPEVDLKSLIGQIQETFGSECMPINLPARKGHAVIDCLLNNVGESDFGPVDRFHSALLDQIVEIDEGLMEKYLSGEEPDFVALHQPFERCLDEGHLVPICFTDARTGVGVPELLEVIARHCPSPEEGNPRPFLAGEGKLETAFEYNNDPGKALLAHVFKVATDPYIGKLAIFRVHQGSASGNLQVFIGHSKKPVRLNRVFHLQGKEHVEADAIIAGDIGAVAKIEEIHVGDVMHDDHALDTVHLKPLVFPVPMFGLAVTPRNRGDEGKISGALTRLQEEDPTFKVTHDPQTHELLINGLGELHLRIMLERLKHRGLEVDTRPPKIAYRETITAPAEGHHRHKKQTGGAGQFGEVFLKVEPLSRGAGFEFVDAVFGGAIPNQFMPAVEKLSLIHI